MGLTEDIHLGLLFPSKRIKSALARGSYLYYHYMCDGINDQGWGCGYRTLQTICSWIRKQQLLNPDCNSSPEVPSIEDFQRALVDIGDKDQSFKGSKQWIGSVEVAYSIEYFYKIQCKILHYRDAKDLEMNVDDIMKHFVQYGSPIMMGGDRDCSSKGILGICETEIGTYLLILDPHFYGGNISREKIQSDGWIKWQRISALDQSSFYNLCCPLIKAAS